MVYGFFDKAGELILSPENTPYEPGQMRVGMKGLPSFGDIRTIMLAVKNGNAKSDRPSRRRGLVQ